MRLGQPERARELLGLFLADRRPPAWNQWPEVVYRDLRAPNFLGDLPHTWVASDFIRSFLDLLAYERDSDQALVLAAGVPDDWIAAPGGVERDENADALGTSRLLADGGGGFGATEGRERD